MSYRATVRCTRPQAEAAPELEVDWPGEPPVLVADEPDPTRPDEWLLHAYFDHAPEPGELATFAALGKSEPMVERLPEADWVTLSQAGLEPIRAGRFFIHTPVHPPARGAINFEIDAGLAFGTGQHATTAGCLEALDSLSCKGCNFTNIADIGTGTGLLAFAALALWPAARCIATDIDPVSIDVTRDNAVLNNVKVGHGTGELLLTVADGMDSPALAARAPFDLLIANILAGPLIQLAPDFVQAIASGGTVILAGLLETQADAVIAAYEAQGMKLQNRSAGEWTILVLKVQ
jgi:ribosomal protein L11 methyltransferase